MGEERGRERGGDRREGRVNREGFRGCVVRGCVGWDCVVRGCVVRGCVVKGCVVSGCVMRRMRAISSTE